MTSLIWPDLGQKLEKVVLPKIFYDQKPKNLKSKKHQNNPWIVKISDEFFSMSGLTPIGTIDKVPTTPRRSKCSKCRTVPVKRMCATPRRSVRLNIIRDDMCTIDPLLAATIYLDFTKSEERPYNYVAEHMQNLSSNISSLQKQFSNTYNELVPLSGIVTNAQFEQALAIYENNQVYYKEMLEKNKITFDEFKKGLNELEQWFIVIIEPASGDYDEWREFEKSKLRNGYSKYCDKDVTCVIESFLNLPNELCPTSKARPVDIRNTIQKYHKILKI